MSSKLQSIMIGQVIPVPGIRTVHGYELDLRIIVIVAGLNS